MPKINTYGIDTAISLDDYLIGSDGDNLKVTKNYKISTLLDYIGNKYNLESQDVFYTYTPKSAAQVTVGSISTNNYASAIIYMSAVTNLYVSKTSALGNMVGDYLSSITSSTLTLIMMDMADPSNYAICNLVSSSNATDDVLNISVEVTASNGRLISGRTIGLRLTAGSQFTGIDYLTLTDDSSIFMGLNAGLSDDGTSNSNIGIGVRSLQDSEATTSIIAIGTDSLADITFGTNNVVIGHSSGGLIASGSNNSMVGVNSIPRSTLTSGNATLGSQTLNDMTNGYANVAIGFNAGNRSNPSGTIVSHTNSIFIGANSKPLGNSSQSEIVIGDNITGDGSRTFKAGAANLNTFRFGNLKNDIQGLTADRTVNWQDKNGTVAYTNDNFFASTISPTVTSGTSVVYAPDIIVPANTLSANGDVLEFNYIFKSIGATLISGISIGFGINATVASSTFNYNLSGTVMYKADGFIQRVSTTSYNMSFTLSVNGDVSPNLTQLGSIGTGSVNTFENDTEFKVSMRDFNGNDSLTLLSGFVRSLKTL